MRSSGEHLRRLVQPSNKLQLLQQRHQEWLSPGVTTSQQSVCSVLYQINTAGSSAVCLPSVRHLPPTIHRLEKHFFSLFLTKSFTFLRLVPLKKSGGGRCRMCGRKSLTFQGCVCGRGCVTLVTSPSGRWLKARRAEAARLSETTRKAAAIAVDYRHESCGLREIYRISERIIGNIITR